jgi:hypothetical protein
MVESPFKRLLAILALGSVAAVSYGLVRHRQGVMVSPPLAIPRSALTTAMLEAPQLTSFAATVVIYVGSSQCIWANRPSLRTSVQAALDSLRQRAARAGEYVTTVGIDLAPLQGTELEHLRSVAEFDQLVLGGDALSSGLSHIAGLDVSDGGQTPQIFVLSHRAEKVSARGEPLVVNSSASTLLVRKIGLEEIKQWTGAGVSVPSVGSQ